MCCSGNSCNSFVSVNFLILYNMNNSNKDLLWVIIEVGVLILVGCASVFGLFMVLSLVRSMVV